MSIAWFTAAPCVLCRQCGEHCSKSIAVPGDPSAWIAGCQVPQLQRLLSAPRMRGRGQEPAGQPLSGRRHHPPAPRACCLPQGHGTLHSACRSIPTRACSSCSSLARRQRSSRTCRCVQEAPPCPALSFRSRQRRCGYEVSAARGCLVVMSCRQECGILRFSASHTLAGEGGDLSVNCKAATAPGFGSAALPAAYCAAKRCRLRMYCRATTPRACGIQQRPELRSDALTAEVARSKCLFPDCASSASGIG